MCWSPPQKGSHVIYYFYTFNFDSHDRHIWQLTDITCLPPIHPHVRQDDHPANQKPSTIRNWTSVTNIRNKHLWQTSVTNICDKYLWQTFVTNICDKMTTQPTKNHQLSENEHLWQTSMTNICDKMTTQPTKNHPTIRNQTSVWSKVMPDVADQEWKEGENHSGVFRQETICKFGKNTSDGLLKVPFLAIWPLVGGASGWFLTIQVNLHVVSFWIFRNTCILNLILTEREVQCSLTAETRANGKVNFSTISIRSSCRISGGGHFWRRRMQNCTDLTRP